MKPSIREGAVTATLAILTLAPSPAIAGEPTYYGASAEARQTVDEEMRVKRFDDQFLTAIANFGEILGQTMVTCDFNAVNEGEPVKGARGRLEGVLAELGPLGNIIQQVTLPGRRLKTGRDGYDSTSWKPVDLNLPMESGAYYAVQILNNLASGKRATEVETSCRLVSYQACQPGPNTLCLLDDRFKVEAMFGNNQAQVFTRQDDEGLLFFNNTDLLIQLIDACGAVGPGSNRYWVFYSATTNVEFEITVIDTLAGETRVYDNPLGTAAPAITDTSAFATCP